MAAAQQQSGWMQGVVKNVPSGDRITIMGVAAKGQTIPPEKEISLAFVTAPRLASARAPEKEEEAFAWQSREYLRRRCIAQRITFRIDYRVDSINREFGTVYVGSENVGVEMTTR